MTDSVVHHDWRDKTILIVEDDDSNYLYFKSLLKQTNACLVRKTNGNEALDFIKNKNNKIDLIIMDILIPFINGIDVTRESKKIRKETPVIIVTAYTSKEVKQKSYLSGCDEYVIKPVLPAQLLELLSEYFHERKDIHSYQLS